MKHWKNLWFLHTNNNYNSVIRTLLLKQLCLHSLKHGKISYNKFILFCIQGMLFETLKPEKKHLILTISEMCVWADNILNMLQL